MYYEFLTSVRSVEASVGGIHSMSTSNPLPRNRVETVVWLLLVAAVAVQVWWLVAPELAGGVEGSGGVQGSAGADVSPPPAAEDDRLFLTADDRDYLNRIYREQSHEVVYCGLLRDQRLVPWLADMTKREPDHAAYRLDNCPLRRATAIANLHTHPAGDTRLSPTDEALLDEQYRYVCVQGGRIGADEGGTTSALACYTETDAGTRRVPVEVY